MTTLRVLCQSSKALHVTPRSSCFFPCPKPKVISQAAKPRGIRHHPTKPSAKQHRVTSRHISPAHLVAAPGIPMLIRVALLSGKSCSVQVPEDASVCELRQASLIFARPRLDMFFSKRGVRAQNLESEVENPEMRGGGHSKVPSATGCAGQTKAIDGSQGLLCSVDFAHAVMTCLSQAPLFLGWGQSQISRIVAFLEGNLFGVVVTGI